MVVEPTLQNQTRIKRFYISTHWNNAYLIALPPLMLFHLVMNEILDCLQIIKSTKALVTPNITMLNSKRLQTKT